MDKRIRLNLPQALAIIDMVDRLAPLADATCDKPGITLCEAARRMLIDQRHPSFVSQ